MRKLGVRQIFLPPNFSKWKPAFDDELQIERPKADRVVAIGYGADSDEPAWCLASFSGGLFIKLSGPSQTFFWL